MGGIDNEALDFGQLESFVHLPTINTSSNNGNASAITLAITAVTTTPAHTITTASASVSSTNAPTHGKNHIRILAIICTNFVVETSNLEMV